MRVKCELDVLNSTIIITQMCIHHRTSSGLHLSQSKYAIDLFHKTNMSTEKSSPTPMSLGNKLSLNDSDTFSHPSLYRSTLEALKYLTMTQPDLVFSVNKLSQFLHGSIVAHWWACKRIMRYVRGTISHGIMFTLTNLLNLEGFSNANWASNLDDRKSISSICIFLGGNLITWSSRKQQVVERSSTEAEYKALSSAVAELVWIQNLLT